MQHIFGKVQVVARKRPPDIVALLVSAVSKPLKLRHDQIIAARPASKRAHMVIDFFSAVYAEHHICHLAVGKLHNLLIQ